MRRRLFAIVFVLLVASSAVPLRASWGGPGPGAVRLAAVGDILLDRGVRAAIATHGPDYPFEAARNLWKDAELVFGNLETPLSRRGSPVLKQFTFCGDPEYGRALSRAGFNVLSLANNHTLDYGRDALLDTVTTLRREGIEPVGAGRNKKEALRPAVVAVKGLRVALVGFTAFPLEGLIPDDDLPGTAYAAEEEVRAAIEAARREADLVVASFHWGIEFSPYPSRRQVQLAHLAVDSGASAVIGHHPHVLQGVERYRGAVILYSLGNFVFDQSRRDTRETAIAVLDLNRSGVQRVEFRPLLITRAQPRPVGREEGQAILTHLNGEF